MAWTLCTSGAAIAKAGTHANSTLIAYGGTNKTILDKWSDEAEGSICAECHTDFVSSITTTYLSISGSISDVCSSKIAKRIIMYDDTGYFSREAETILDVNDDIETKGLIILKDKTKQRLST
jgi:hypothetical protein